MTHGKRLFDVTLAIVLGVFLMPLLTLLLLWLGLREGRPLFFASERMSAPGVSFRLWKLRTMRCGSDDGRATGGHKEGRVTQTGRWLRRTRLDELPQLWNILRGDMSFVGPRPPLRRYVEAYPDLYARILHSRPGVTGLATVVFHAHEARLMARCTTGDEAEGIYLRSCLPRKARLDLIYQKHGWLGFDLRILIRTVGVVLRS
ncbi:MAG: sugar transferase [Sulfitobacter sp.]|nr:sugar transferase [Sulfitobacter sp.]